MIWTNYLVDAVPLHICRMYLKMDTTTLKGIRNITVVFRVETFATFSLKTSLCILCDISFFLKINKIIIVSEVIIT